jgi:hypothetical protein
MVTAASVRGQELAVPKKQGSPDRPGRESDILNGEENQTKSVTLKKLLPMF